MLWYHELARTGGLHYQTQETILDEISRHGPLGQLLCSDQMGSCGAEEVVVQR